MSTSANGGTAIVLRQDQFDLSPSPPLSHAPPTHDTAASSYPYRNSNDGEKKPRLASVRVPTYAAVDEGYGRVAAAAEGGGSPHHNAASAQHHSSADQSSFVFRSGGVGSTPTRGRRGGHGAEVASPHRAALREAEAEASFAAPMASASGGPAATADISLFGNRSASKTPTHSRTASSASAAPNPPPPRTAAAKGVTTLLPSAQRRLSLASAADGVPIYVTSSSNGGGNSLLLGRGHGATAAAGGSGYPSAAATPREMFSGHGGGGHHHHHHSVPASPATPTSSASFVVVYNPPTAAPRRAATPTRLPSAGVRARADSSAASGDVSTSGANPPLRAPTSRHPSAHRAPRGASPLRGPAAAADISAASTSIAAVNASKGNDSAVSRDTPNAAIATGVQRGPQTTVAPTTTTATPLQQRTSLIMVADDGAQEVNDASNDSNAFVAAATAAEVQAAMEALRQSQSSALALAQLARERLAEAEALTNQHRQRQGAEKGEEEACPPPPPSAPPRNEATNTNRSNGVYFNFGGGHFSVGTPTRKGRATSMLGAPVEEQPATVSSAAETNAVVEHSSTQLAPIQFTSSTAAHAEDAPVRRGAPTPSQPSPATVDDTTDGNRNRGAFYAVGDEVKEEVAMEAPQQQQAAESSRIIGPHALLASKEGHRQRGPPSSSASDTPNDSPIRPTGAAVADGHNSDGAPMKSGADVDVDCSVLTRLDLDLGAPSGAQPPPSASSASGSSAPFVVVEGKPHYSQTQQQRHSEGGADSPLSPAKRGASGDRTTRGRSRSPINPILTRLRSDVMGGDAASHWEAQYSREVMPEASRGYNTNMRSSDSVVVADPNSASPPPARPIRSGAVRGLPNTALYGNDDLGFLAMDAERARAARAAEEKAATAKAQRRGGRAADGSYDNAPARVGGTHASHTNAAAGQGDGGHGHRGREEVAEEVMGSGNAVAEGFLRSDSSVAASVAQHHSQRQQQRSPLPTAAGRSGGISPLDERGKREEAAGSASRSVSLHYEQQQHQQQRGEVGAPGAHYGGKGGEAPRLTSVRAEPFVPSSSSYSHHQHAHSPSPAAPSSVTTVSPRRRHGNANNGGRVSPTQQHRHQQQQQQQQQQPLARTQKSGATVEKAQPLAPSGSSTASAAAIEARMIGTARVAPAREADNDYKYSYTNHSEVAPLTTCTGVGNHPTAAGGSAAAVDAAVATPQRKAKARRVYTVGVGLSPAGAAVMMPKVAAHRDAVTDLPPQHSEAVAASSEGAPRTPAVRPAPAAAPQPSPPSQHADVGTAAVAVPSASAARVDVGRSSGEAKHSAYSARSSAAPSQTRDALGAMGASDAPAATGGRSGAHSEGGQRVGTAEEPKKAPVVEGSSRRDISRAKIAAIASAVALTSDPQEEEEGPIDCGNNGGTTVTTGTIAAVGSVATNCAAPKSNERDASAAGITTQKDTRSKETHAERRSASLLARVGAAVGRSLSAAAEAEAEDDKASSASSSEPLSHRPRHQRPRPSQEAIEEGVVVGSAEAIEPYRSHSQPSAESHATGPSSASAPQSSGAPTSSFIDQPPSSTDAAPAHSAAVTHQDTDTAHGHENTAAKVSLPQSQPQATNHRRPPSASNFLRQASSRTAHLALSSSSDDDDDKDGGGTSTAAGAAVAKGTGGAIVSAQPFSRDRSGVPLSAPPPAPPQPSSRVGASAAAATVAQATSERPPSAASFDYSRTATANYLAFSRAVSVADGGGTPLGFYPSAASSGAPAANGPPVSSSGVVAGGGGRLPPRSVSPTQVAPASFLGSFVTPNDGRSGGAAASSGGVGGPPRTVVPRPVPALVAAARGATSNTTSTTEADTAVSVNHAAAADEATIAQRSDANEPRASSLIDAYGDADASSGGAFGVGRFIRQPSGAATPTPVPYPTSHAPQPHTTAGATASSNIEEAHIEEDSRGFATRDVASSVSAPRPEGTAPLPNPNPSIAVSQHHSSAWHGVPHLRGRSVSAAGDATTASACASSCTHSQSDDDGDDSTVDDMSPSRDAHTSANLRPIPTSSHGHDYGAAPVHGGPRTAAAAAVYRAAAASLGDGYDGYDSDRTASDVDMPPCEEKEEGAGNELMSGAVGPSGSNGAKGPTELAMGTAESLLGSDGGDAPPPTAALGERRRVRPSSPTRLGAKPTATAYGSGSQQQRRGSSPIALRSGQRLSGAPTPKTTAPPSPMQSPRRSEVSTAGEVPPHCGAGPLLPLPSSGTSRTTCTAQSRPPNNSVPSSPRSPLRSGAAPPPPATVRGARAELTGASNANANSSIPSSPTRSPAAAKASAVAAAIVASVVGDSSPRQQHQRSPLRRSAAVGAASAPSDDDGTCSSADGGSLRWGGRVSPMRGARRGAPTAVNTGSHQQNSAAFPTAVLPASRQARVGVTTATNSNNANADVPIVVPTAVTTATASRSSASGRTAGGSSSATANAHATSTFRSYPSQATTEVPLRGAAANEHVGRWGGGDGALGSAVRQSRGGGGSNAAAAPLPSADVCGLNNSNTFGDSGGGQPSAAWRQAPNGGGSGGSGDFGGGAPSRQGARGEAVPSVGPIRMAQPATALSHNNHSYSGQGAGLSPLRRGSGFGYGDDNSGASFSSYRRPSAAAAAAVAASVGSPTAVRQTHTLPSSRVGAASASANFSQRAPLDVGVGVGGGGANAGAGGPSLPSPRTRWGSH